MNQDSTEFKVNQVSSNQTTFTLPLFKKKIIIDKRHHLNCKCHFPPFERKFRRIY